MIHIFYLYSVLMVFYNFLTLIFNKPYNSLIKMFQEFNKKDKKSKDFTTPYEERVKIKKELKGQMTWLGSIGILMIFHGFVNLIWFMCGLLTPQWFIYLGFWIFMFTIAIIKIYIFKQVISRAWIILVSLLNISFYSFIVINYYHLNIF